MTLSLATALRIEPGRRPSELLGAADYVRAAREVCATRLGARGRRAFADRNRARADYAHDVTLKRLPGHVKSHVPANAPAGAGSLDH